jgi:hypothetical protein
MPIKNWFYLKKDAAGIRKDDIEDPTDAYVNVVDADSPNSGNVMSVADFSKVVNTLNFKEGSVGPKVSFVKPNDANYEFVKDVIIPGELEITRGNIRGIYNIALESSYDNDDYDSPLNTYWFSQYTDENVPVNPLAPLTEIPNRNYGNWRNAVDGNPPASVGMPVIMKWDNGSDAPRYWVVEFTEWGIGSDNNNFGYTRYELFLSVNVEQPSSSNPNQPQIIDIVSPGVHLAREYSGGGLYNIVSENQYDDLSPKDTRWNSQYTDSRIGYSGFSDLSNVESRIYSNFQDALDGSIGSNVLNTDLVMHDLTTDLYYKVVFDSWAQGCNQYTSGYPGKPTGWNIVNAGSGYPDGGWYNPTVTGGSGTNGNVIIQVSGGVPYIIAWGGSVGYQIGDIITLDYPGVTDPTVIELTTLCLMGGFSYTRTVIPQSCAIKFADGTSMDTAPVIPTPTYKVYTALLTQNGDGNTSSLDSGTLDIGRTYWINHNSPGMDFTNVGAPNNDINTYFVATGTTPNSWGIDEGEENILYTQNGAPVVTVLENTIGNVWFTYNFVGDYSVVSSDLFTKNKVFTYIGCDPNFDPNDNPVAQAQIKRNDSTSIFIQSFIIDTNGVGVLADGLMAFGTPIEIRVYN